ncbi:hypothetical protein BDB01DRAFT_805541 [Pilobolus umbonatus]|nr:hypothetical protein BDB01DRAFT_805541 [Pilobolus umbonatus]
MNQQTSTVEYFKHNIWDILTWKDPQRSAILFLFSMCILFLTGTYSVLQMICSLLSIAIGVNIVYVGITLFSQQIIIDCPPVNPYRRILDEKEGSVLIDRNNVAYYTAILTDILEYLMRALTRIVLVDDMKTSIRWLILFFTTWKLAVYIPSRLIIGLITVSAFIFPRLYLSNKDLFDARSQQGHALINTQLEKIHQCSVTQINRMKEMTASYRRKKTS